MSTTSSPKPRTSNELASSLLLRALEHEKERVQRWLIDLAEAEQQNDPTTIYARLDFLDALCNLGVIYDAISSRQAKYLCDLRERDWGRNHHVERIVTYQGQEVGLWEYLAPGYNDLYRQDRMRFILDPAVVQAYMEVAPDLLQRARLAAVAKWKDDEERPVNEWMMHRIS